MIDTIVEVNHVIVLQIEMFHHKIDIFLILEIDTNMKELLVLHNLADQDMTIIDEIHALIVNHTDLLIDSHIYEIHALDIDQIHTPETDHFRHTLLHKELLLDLSDLDHILKQKKWKSFKEKSQLLLLTLKSTCTIPPR